MTPSRFARRLPPTCFSSVGHSLAIKGPVPRRRARGRRICNVAILLCALGYGHAHALDVNQATVSQLEALRGLGAKTAALIVKERARGGPYESIAHMAERVKGLGAKRARALEASGLRVGPAPLSKPPVLPSGASPRRPAPPS